MLQNCFYDKRNPTKEDTTMKNRNVIPLGNPKIETSVLIQRKNQPWTWEVMSFLCENGFWLVNMIDLHRWRRRPVPEHPYIVDYVMPYSKGVLAHCDLIFLKDFRKINNEEEALRLSVVTAILGFFDFGISLLRHFPGRSGPL